MSLERTKLIEKIKEYMYIEDENEIDLAFATYLSVKNPDTKIFLCIVKNSGGGKGFISEMLDDNRRYVFSIQKLNSNTFINGWKNKEKNPDLVPMLDNKLVLIPEIAGFTTSEDQAKIWESLLNLYDGKAQRLTAGNLDNGYQDLNIGLLFFAVPKVYEEILLKQELGTRILFYRGEYEDKNKLMDKIVQNSNINQKEKRLELHKEIQDYLLGLNYMPLEIEENTSKLINNWALLCTNLRVATPEMDLGNGELMSKVAPEEPTRILHQLRKIYRCLKCLEKGYSDERALCIIKDVILSSCDPVRIEVLNFLCKDPLFRSEGYSSREVANEINISPKKIMSELCVLTQLGIIDRISREVNSVESKYYFKFRMNKMNPFYEEIMKFFEISPREIRI